jgi:hypothetical protein
MKPVDLDDAPYPAIAEDRSGGWQNIFWAPFALTILFVAIGVLLPGRRLGWTFTTVGEALLAWQLLLWHTMASAGRKAGVEIRVVKSHYVQAMVQLCVYAYWGWYWRRVYAQAPLILAQIVFLYVFDVLLSWSRGRAWRLGLGPFPIILSTNFFMWFKEDWFVFQFLMIATGALAKEFIRWERGGRRIHVFNPSAFGLALFSLGLLVTGTSRNTWAYEIATTLAMPRFIYLEIFLVGLIVQGFFGVTLVTLSATATLCLANLGYTHFMGGFFFGDVTIPIAVFLGLHLLVTDPATSPRTNMGKAIFGIFYGLGIMVTYAILRRLALPDFYDKLLVVPVLNLGVRVLDRLAEWTPLKNLGEWETVFGLRRLNLIHMGCWGALFMVMLGTGYVGGPEPQMSDQGRAAIAPAAPVVRAGGQ